MNKKELEIYKIFKWKMPIDNTDPNEGIGEVIHYLVADNKGQVIKWVKDNFPEWDHQYGVAKVVKNSNEWNSKPDIEPILLYGEKYE